MLLSLACAVGAAPSQALESAPSKAIETAPAVLPHVLGADDAQRYREIFDLQRRGQMQAADRLIGELTDVQLMGHVQFQRYMHPTAYRSSYKELKQWMDAYRDHPGARRIYTLALRRQPKGWKSPLPPLRSRDRAAGPRQVEIYRSGVRRSAARRREVNWAKTRIGRYIRRGEPTNALKFLERKEVDRLLDAVETDIARQKIAKGYFLAGLDQKALVLAERAAARSGAKVPRAHWYAGLAAWRTGQPERAGTHFAAIADGNSPYTSPRERAAGAFWAARVNLVTGRPEAVNRYLRIAASTPRTFYGMLAHRQLGRELPFDWVTPHLTANMLSSLHQWDAVARMIALVEAGQTHLADSEMRHLHGRVSSNQDAALMALATALHLPASQLRMAASAERAASSELAALYPIPSWEPDGGFTSEPALLYAFMRQESRFMAHAKSHSGARGLMQIMPATASFIGSDASLRHSGRHRLFEPQFNLTLGQRYIEYLLAQPDQHGDIFALAAAYNGGPGNLRRWQRKNAHSGDPLLFIETIPKPETRDFVRRIATNYWIYQHRLGQGQHTLDAVARGQWPTYVQEQGPPGKQASPAANCSKEIPPCRNLTKVAHSYR